MRFVFITLLIITQANVLFAQQGDIESHINKLVQRGDEVENQGYYDLLLYYFDNPIDINKTNIQELSQLNILNIEQIRDILNHISATGGFSSIYELQSIASLELSEIKMILPFITVGKNESLVKILKNLAKSNANYATVGYSRVVELSKAYTNNIYLGSPDRVQTRLRLRNPGHLSIGLSAQKDPGESWLTETTVPSPDYVSGHLYLENHGRIKQLVLGDYRLQFGQGLVLGSGFMVGKNVETVASIKQSSIGILPYSSISEADYFRGSGVNLILTKNLNIALFYSNQNLDATVVKDSTLVAVSSIRISGLHRTISEVNAINQLHEQAWGSSLIYDNKKFSTGLLFVNTQFNKPIIPSSSNYNLYSFNGNKLLNYSWFGQYRADNFLFFSEIAKTHNAGVGINLGLIGSVSKYVSVSMLYRSFDKNFHSLYGLPFSERSSIGNENGLYWGIKIYPISRLIISAYYDMYKFPWLTSRTVAPTTGNDYLIRLEYKFNDQSKTFVQFRNENVQVKTDAGNISQNQPIQLFKSILNFDYNLEHPLSFRTRIQYNRFIAEYAENGWLLYQDINYSQMKFGLTGRILVFDTDSYNSRQYVYEKDMLFTFNTRVFSGKGLGYYVIIKYKPSRNLSFRAKWSYTEYIGQSNIGSGNDLIIGNHKTQITGQLHYTF